MGQVKKSLTLKVEYKEQFDLLNTEEKVELLEALFCYAETGEVLEMSNLVKMAFIFIRQQMDDEDRAYKERCETNRKNVLKRYTKDKENYDRIPTPTTVYENYDRIPSNTTVYDGSEFDTDVETAETGTNTESEELSDNVDEDGFVNIDDDDEENQRKKEAKKETVENINNNINNNTKEKNNTPPISPPKKKRKVFVKPTVDEIRAYCEERGNGISAEEFYDSCESKGWVVGKYQTPMKDWQATIRTWEKNRGFKYTPKPKDSPPKIPDRYADYQ